MKVLWDISVYRICRYTSNVKYIIHHTDKSPLSNNRCVISGTTRVLPQACVQAFHPNPPSSDRPIRGQYPGHMITLGQSEAGIKVMWSPLNQPEAVFTPSSNRDQVVHLPTYSPLTLACLTHHTPPAGGEYLPENISRKIGVMSRKWATYSPAHHTSHRPVLWQLWRVITTSSRQIIQSPSRSRRQGTVQYVRARCKEIVF